MGVIMEENGAMVEVLESERPLSQRQQERKGRTIATGENGMEKTGKEQHDEKPCSSKRRDEVPDPVEILSEEDERDADSDGADKTYHRATLFDSDEEEHQRSGEASSTWLRVWRRKKSKGPFRGNMSKAKYREIFYGKPLSSPNLRTGQGNHHKGKPHMPALDIISESRQEIKCLLSSNPEETCKRTSGLNNHAKDLQIAEEEGPSATPAPSLPFPSIPSSSSLTEIDEHQGANEFIFSSFSPGVDLYP